MNKLCNKKSIVIIILLNIGFLFSTCQKDKITPMEYPRLDIYDEIGQNESGVTFKATILSEGDLPIVEKGFCWSTSPMPNLSSSKISAENFSQIGQFSAFANIDFEIGKTYYLRAFAKTKEMVVYSKEIQFVSKYSTPLPEIKDFYPKSAKWNDTVNISGKNFSFISKNIKVLFDEVNAVVYSSCDTLIKVLVPPGSLNTSVQLQIKVYNKTDVSTEKFTYIFPQIDDFFPKNGTFNDTITITGSNFPLDSKFINIKFGDVSAIALNIKPSELKVLIPYDVSLAQLEFKAEICGTNKIFDEKFTLNPPQITDFSPKEVFQNNTKITIYGNNFNPKRGANFVYIGNKLAEVIKVSKNEIEISSPKSLIPDQQISVFDSLQLSVIVSGQTALSADSLHINYSSRWTRKKDFPGEPRCFAVSFSYNGKGYYGLGTNNEYYNLKAYSDFWEFDPMLNRWTQKASLPSNGRAYSSYFELNGKFYVCCGLYYNTSLSEVWEYNPINDIWIRKNDFPGGARNSAFNFIINGKAYLGGGTSYTTQNIYDVWEYDSMTDNWNTKINIAALDIAWVGEVNAFSVLGSGYLLADERNFDRECWKYNVNSNSWNLVKSMPGDVMKTTGFVINDIVYIGTGEGFRSSPGFYKYEPLKDTWTSIGFKEANRSGANSFTSNNKGYIVGGRYEYNQPKNDIWEFDPTK